MICEEELKKIDQFIGKRIRLSRTAKNISTKEFAKLLEITEEQLLKYELGNNRLSMIELTNIAKTLKENIDFFLP